MTKYKVPNISIHVYQNTENITDLSDIENSQLVKGRIR